MNPAMMYRLTFLKSGEAAERHITFAAPSDPAAEAQASRWVASWGARTWTVKRLRALALSVEQPPQLSLF